MKTGSYFVSFIAASPVSRKELGKMMTTSTYLENSYVMSGPPEAYIQADPS